MEPKTCACGASGDLGEMVEHVVAGLEALDDDREHVLDCAEPAQVAETREAVERRREVQEALAAAAGVTWEELRDALQ